MDEAAQADRLVVMAKGRVIADGAPKEIFQDVEGLKAVGLTVPETTQLLWELRREGLDVPLDALSDEDALFVGDILASGYWGAELCAFQPGDTAVVLGLGPVGLPTHNPAKRLCVGEDEQRNE